MISKPFCLGPAPDHAESWTSCPYVTERIMVVVSWTAQTYNEEFNINWLQTMLGPPLNIDLCRQAYKS